MGLVGVLQTWGRDLCYHPHVHYLVPGGGLAPDGQSWLPARPNFLVPVKWLSLDHADTPQPPAAQTPEPLSQEQSRFCPQCGHLMRLIDTISAVPDRPRPDPPWLGFCCGCI